MKRVLIGCALLFAGCSYITGPSRQQIIASQNTLLAHAAQEDERAHKKEVIACQNIPEGTTLFGIMNEVMPIGPYSAGSTVESAKAYIADWYEKHRKRMANFNACDNARFVASMMDEDLADDEQFVAHARAVSGYNIHDIPIPTYPPDTEDGDAGSDLGRQQQQLQQEQLQQREQKDQQQQEEQRERIQQQYGRDACNEPLPPPDCPPGSSPPSFPPPPIMRSSRVKYVESSHA